MRWPPPGHVSCADCGQWIYAPDESRSAVTNTGWVCPPCWATLMAQARDAEDRRKREATA